MLLHVCIDAYNEEQVRYVWKFDGNSSIKTAEGMRLSQFDLIGTTAWHQVEHLPYGESRDFLMTKSLNIVVKLFHSQSDCLVSILTAVRMLSVGRNCNGDSGSYRILLLMASYFYSLVAPACVNPVGY